MQEVKDLLQQAMEKLEALVNPTSEEPQTEPEAPVEPAEGAVS